MTIEQLYEQHIKHLSLAEKLRLVALIAQGLAEQLANAPSTVTSDSKEWLGPTREFSKGADAPQ